MNEIKQNWSDNYEFLLSDYGNDQYRLSAKTDGNSYINWGPDQVNTIVFNTKEMLELRNLIDNVLENSYYDSLEASDQEYEFDDFDRYDETPRPKPKLIFQKTDDCPEFIKLPEYKTTKAAAFDLQCMESVTVQPGHWSILRTGLRVKIPNGYKLEFKSRSGLSAKQGIEKGAGLIDADYCDELKVVLFNHSNIPAMFVEGDRVVQAEICESIQANISWGEVPLKDEESNRIGGIGSTGLK